MVPILKILLIGECLKLGSKVNPAAVVHSPTDFLFEASKVAIFKATDGRI